MAVVVQHLQIMVKMEMIPRLVLGQPFTVLVVPMYQLASVASLVRRARPEADVIWIDEAHRVPGESYQQILRDYPDALIIGLTATPCRLDGQPLRPHFDVMIEVGGLTRFAAGDRSVLVRNFEGHKETIKVHLDGLVKDGDVADNIQMRPGDILIIPQRYF